METSTPKGVDTDHMKDRTPGARALLSNRKTQPYETTELQDEPFGYDRRDR